MNRYIDKLLKQKIIAGLILYLLALGIAEVTAAYYPTEYYGLLIHAAIMLSLVVLSSYTKEVKYSRLLQGLALASMIRILSTSIPLLVFLNPIYIFVLIYSMLIFISYFFLKSQKISMEDAGVTVKNLKLQALIALSGPFFGVIEYFILKGYLPVTEITYVGEIISSIIIMIFFVGFTEELIFRGIILQHTTKILSANKSILFASILFMLMHMGWHSPMDLAFVFGVGLFYGYAFIKTGSIIGITLSHGLTNVFEYIVIPAFFLS